MRCNVLGSQSHGTFTSNRLLILIWQLSGARSQLHGKRRHDEASPSIHKAAISLPMITIRISHASIEDVDDTQEGQGDLIEK